MLKKVVNLITIFTILATTTCTSEDTWNWEDDINRHDTQKDNWILPKNQTIRGHRDSIKKIRYSPDGMMLAVARGNGITLYNIETRKELFVLSGHTDWVQSISFSPTGDTLASASWDKTIRLWNTHTGVSNIHLPNLKIGHGAYLSVRLEIHLRAGVGALSTSGILVQEKSKKHLRTQISGER